MLMPSGNMMEHGQVSTQHSNSKKNGACPLHGFGDLTVHLGLTPVNIPHQSQGRRALRDESLFNNTNPPYGCPVAGVSGTSLSVGTQLYIAPEAEVSSRRKSPRNHNKAHMYSLRTVSFDMVYAFSIGADRIAVIEDLRKPEVYFPRDWKAHRSQQKQTKPDSPYYQSVLSALFSRPASQFRSLLYDLEEAPEHAQLHNIVEERISAIFRLHGAVNMEPPLLAPSTNPEENQSQPTSIYRHGIIIPLPNNVLLPFARLVARRESGVRNSNQEKG
ncbi:hypothetical protein BU15DRAFT_79047 [Melanogaster broomeanus]|nr:hypothetical protein BU15DRAFT_79047 [Melanogaster broomeanus]